jgi:hypothetical protein
MARKNLKVVVADAETDPFKYGRPPMPFVWGFYDGVMYRWFWGADCTDQFFRFLDEYPDACRIYIHNGGKFDFFFMLDRMQNPVKIINGRIVSFKYGKHTFVCSWAIIPESLEKANKKTKIDYALFEKEFRNENRRLILDYLLDDCMYLYELVTAFVDEFGPRLTIGGTAMHELKKHHRTQNCGPTHDAKFRKFYFGGRVQCFETGPLVGNFKLIDVNSMYPHVMANMDHPIGDEYEFTTSLDRAINSNMPFFVEFDGVCADLPLRVKQNVLYSDRPGRFAVTGHEFKAAYDLNVIKSAKNFGIWIATDKESYYEFISHFNAKKVQAEIMGDKIRRSFYKRVNNSAYGRFAIDPEKFRDYHVRKLGETLPDKFRASGEPMADYGAFEIWETPSVTGQYQDVAIGASITGAARSVLLRAKDQTTRPIYCDTDSIVCEDFHGDEHPTKLGAWKTEMDGIDHAYIAGKKLYALYSNGECKKYASKGCRLEPEQIKRVCEGAEIMYNQIAPNFSLKGGPMWLHRTIKSTF